MYRSGITTLCDFIRPVLDDSNPVSSKLRCQVVQIQFSQMSEMPLDLLTRNSITSYFEGACKVSGEFRSEQVLHAMSIIAFGMRRLWMVNIQLRNDLLLEVVQYWSGASLRLFSQSMGNLFFTLWIQKRKLSSLSVYFNGSELQTRHNSLFRRLGYWVRA
jgi:hypothetical protein